MAVDNSKIVYGGSMMLFMKTGATLTPIAFSTSAKLTVSMATRDAASKDSGNWGAKLPAKFDWNVGTDALVAYDTVSGTTDIENLYTAMLTRSAIPISFAASTGTSPTWSVSGIAFTGSVYITSIDITAADGDNAQYSISTEGTGELALA